MWRNKISVLPAVSLVELLISLALGSLLLSAAAALYSHIYLQQTKYRELINLQAHTHQLLDYLNQHIQHMNLQGQPHSDSNYALFQHQGKNYHLIHQSCLLFFNDVNQDGCVGNRIKSESCHLNGMNNTNEVGKELFGFKFENQAIYVFNDDSAIRRCHQTQCEKVLTSCQHHLWHNLVEQSDYRVDMLRFQWEMPERLLNIELALTSLKQPEIRYQAQAYSYLFNGAPE